MRSIRVAPAVMFAAFLLLGAGSGTPHAGLVSYELSWDTARVDRSGGEGWSVRTDLGYSVRVSRGWLVSYRMSLVPCEHPQPRAAAALGVATAWAGHPEIPDPSTVLTPRVESLTALQPVRLGEFRVSATSYCKAHWLVARADDTTQAMPVEADLTRTTLHVELEVTGTGGRTRSLVIRSNSASGVLRDAAGASIADTGAGDVAVRVRRDAGALFDGIDFDAADDEEIAKAMLSNLTRGVRFELGVTSRRGETAVVLQVES